MDIRARAIREDEFDRFITVDANAFGRHAPPEDLEDSRAELDWRLCVGAFDGDALIGAASHFELELTLPGGAVLPVPGVTYVAVLPTHRRRGALTALMAHQLDGYAEAGCAAAILTASEAGIYGRFGYGLAARAAKVLLDTTGGLPLARPAATGGRLRLLDAGDAAAAVPALWDRYRRTRAGEVSVSDARWSVWFRDRESWRGGATARFYVVHDPSGGGAPDGFAAYRIHERWGDEDTIPRNEVRLEQLAAADPEVEVALLDYLGGIDLSTAVTSWQRPVDDWLPHRLTDSRRYRVSLVQDHLYARLLDVPAALSARTYEGSGDLVLAVDDPFRPARAGRFRLVVGDDGRATSERVGDVEGPCDLRLGVDALGSLFLGDARPWQLAAAGRARPASPAALATADRVFGAARLPHCTVAF